MASLNQPLRVMHIISGDLWAGAEVQAYTLLKHLNPQCQLCVICLNNSELSSRLIALNIAVEVIPETKLNAIQVLFRIFKAIRQFKPDIVHTHRQKENILGAVANLLTNPIASRRAKCLRTAHGAPEYAPKGLQRLQVALDIWVAKHLQCGIIAVSQDLGQLLERAYPKEKIYVIHNGVDVEALRPTKSIELNSNGVQPAKHIGIVGRLEQIKRVDLFINAANILLTERNFSGQFHVIGDGALRQELEILSQSLGIANAVTFHGHQAGIHGYIKSLDILVICSDHEGTPMVVLEACALGTRIVAHNTGGLPEIITPEQGHYFSREHSSVGYADAIEQSLLSNMPPRPLQSRFTAQCNADSISNLYANKSKKTAKIKSTLCT